MLCGQGVAPAAATIERFRELGHDLVPGTGLLAACVPGAFGGWLLLLRDFGTWRLEDVLAFAIGYAEDGYPVVDGIRMVIERDARAARDLAGLARALPPAARGRRALPQPGARRHVSAHPRRGARRLARGRDRARAPSSSTRASSPRRSHRFSRGGRRPADRRRPRRLAGDGRAGREPRLPRHHRLQDAAVGLRARRAAAAGAARGLRPRRAVRGGARPRRHRVREARLRRPRRPLRRRRRAARDAALAEYNDTRRALVGDDASGELRARRSAGCRRLVAAAAPPARASRRAATPSTSTSPTASGTWSRRRRAAAGCRARR